MSKTFDISTKQNLDWNRIGRHAEVQNVKCPELFLGLYLGFECNLFFPNALFWFSGDNLGLKHPASSCKRVSFAAGVQSKSKHCWALKVAKGPLIWFKKSHTLRCFSSRIFDYHIFHTDLGQSAIQFERILTSLLIIIEKILNRPVAKFYSSLKGGQLLLEL